MADKKVESAEFFAHRIVIWWLPILYVLISSLFYLRTYDSAQVKITVMQMGGIALLAFWVVRLMEAGTKAFSKEDLVCLSPFIAYLLVGIFSFLHAPYHMSSVDFFIRHSFYMIVSLIVIYEFDSDATERLTKFIILAGWIAVGYGFLQLLDGKLFPPGIGKGIDPFIWRGAFGDRVFSTYGNPNFFGDFCVILFPILLMQYFKTKRLLYLPLLFMLVVDLYMTGTKGAWLGFALVIFLFGIVAFTYFKEQTRAYRVPVAAVVALGVLAFGGFVAKDLQTRVVSVNFRLFTWEATWEMIMTNPLFGTGVGSFPPIYPAFRRPAIFHIEGKHNTETDHAEDEYIEQLLDNGIVGFGIFLWLILSTLFVGHRSVGQLTTSLAMKDGRPPPRAYDLIGYMVAFMGMLGHNFFDVSLRFVSSGVYLGLLSGMIVNLARGRGLYELHGLKPTHELPSAAEQKPWTQVASEFLIWPVRLLAWGGLGYAALLICREFSEVQGPLGRLSLGGEILQWWLAWLVLGGCVLALTAFFVRLVHLSDKPIVPVAVFLALYPLYIFWGYFKADVNHNIAIYFSKERNWDMALAHYQKVFKLNPDFVMAKYFTGNVFNDRFNMVKVYNPKWGDKDNVARDDYERALDAYNEVRRLSPNYVQMHHQVGALHMRRAQFASDGGRPDEAKHYLDLAENRLKLYRAIDPVFPANYYRLAQIYMIQQRWGDAARIYEDLIRADGCAVDPSLTRKPGLLKTILAYQAYTKEPASDAPVHRHENAEAYTNLANAYFMLNRLRDAEAAYRKALVFDANFEQAKKNLTVTMARLQAEGRGVKVIPAAPIPAVVPPAGYEIIPSKK